MSCLEILTVWRYYLLQKTGRYKGHLTSGGLNSCVYNKHDILGLQINMGILELAEEFLHETV